MKIAVENAHSPRYSQEDESVINLIIKFEHLDSEVEFSASLNDVEEHGRNIYIAAKAGEYGDVQPYEPLI